MKLSKEQRTDIIRVRLENAKSSINEAKLLLRSKAIRGAANRVYFAMFYAVSALTIFKERSFSKHTCRVPL